MTETSRTLALVHRGVLRITGEDAKTLLDGILTCDLDRISPDKARLGALLSPQGKILFDFLIVAAPRSEPQGYYLDCPRAVAGDFAKRLGFYKLRARVTIENLSETHRVKTGWGGVEPAADEGIVFADPRLAALGWRAITGIAGEGAGDPGAYLAHRIALGVPDAHEDFSLGDIFPHEMMMDQLHGVDFDKGCYIGQEVVSRMQHRGTARTRILIAYFEGDAPVEGGEVTAGGKVLGRLGSVGGGKAIALIRLDRASEAMAEGRSITAGGTTLALQKPDYARFAFPLADATAP